MQETRGLCVLLISLSFLLHLVSPANADAAPGNVIDQSNWEEAEGLLPNPHLQWVKDGKMSLKLGELTYDPSEYFSQDSLDLMVGNVGKYSIDEKGWITETATGKPAKHVLGFPFPKIDMEDPKAGVKVMHNKVYTWYLTGSVRITYELLWIGSNLERSITNMSLLTPLQGWPGVEKLKNRENFEKLGLTIVTEPVDLKGASSMTWRYMDPGKEDSTFAYMPMTRRVRQISPANRSNAVAGSDLCIDDGNGYDGKVQAFEWKLLRKQEALVPYIDESPMPLERTRRGEWASTKQQKILISGYEDKEWQGAPWAVMNYIWIKRPVYVVEARAKDPYYNYGVQRLWVDTETYAVFYKIIHDRAGDYWKASFAAFAGYRSPGDEMKLHALSHGVMIDDRTGHATGTELISPRHILYVGVDFDMRDYSLAGFQKWCQ
jgi:hypothetical protein